MLKLPDTNENSKSEKKIKARKKKSYIYADKNSNKLSTLRGASLWDKPVGRTTRVGLCVWWLHDESHDCQTSFAF